MPKKPEDEPEDGDRTEPGNGDRIGSGNGDRIGSVTVSGPEPSADEAPEPGGERGAEPGRERGAEPESEEGAEPESEGRPEPEGGAEPGNEGKPEPESGSGPADGGSPEDPAPAAEPGRAATTPATPSPATPPDESRRSRAVLAALVAGVVAAVVVPYESHGVGWPVAAFAVLALVGRVRPGWAALSVLLASVAAFRASDWLFALCLVTGLVTASIAVTGGRTARGLLWASVAVPATAPTALSWGARGVSARATGGWLRPVALTCAVLLVFLPLLVSADEAFADLVLGAVLRSDTPIGVTAVLGAAAGAGVLAAHRLRAVPNTFDAPLAPAPAVARRDWALPVGALVALFAAFVAVQLRTLFGGDRHVQVTADLTYADYARGGFGQLLVVTLLTLGVLGAVSRFAARATARDRLWLRALPGALCALTLVIVASAVHRMWLYQQAYGFTEQRVLALAAELWLGLVCLAVLAAGVRLSAAWLPRAVVATAAGAVLALAVADPELLIAEANVARYEATGRIDRSYLATLSVDAAPALARLPEELRVCHWSGRKQHWNEWNLAWARWADEPWGADRCRW
ncbi:MULTISPECIES: DUF4153 domain-containing protein [Actinosynnema]|uniref:DUF4153 domain-containing protein n=1 Tax=Actinosynnema TaxID=40566 RepID=UPI0020A4CA62|nr:DUF4153 domain-containing protein [Actinosynnema pretiosum]MCP2098001.1 protein of unknown function (DUF4173) [Actinosynnema pretiosum]